MRFAGLVLSLALLVPVAAGCGDGDRDGKAGGEAATERTADRDEGQRPDSHDEPAPTGASGDSPGDEPVPALPADPTPEEFVDTCFANVERNQVSAKRKEELRDICRDYASGDEERIRKASGEVCKTIVTEQIIDRKRLLKECIETMSERLPPR